MNPILVKLIASVTVRVSNLRNSFQSAYWGALITGSGGRVGRNLVVRSGGTFSLAPGAVVEIGDEVTIAEGAGIFVGPGARLSIGARVFIGRGTVIGCNERIEIGEGTQVAHNATVIDTNHRFDRPDVPLVAQGAETAPIEIGAEVWIGSGAVILKGRKLGDHSVVGAGSVVTRDVPRATVAIGNPAREVQPGKDRPAT